MQNEALLLEYGYKIYETPDGGTEIYNPIGNFSGEVFERAASDSSNSSR